MNSSHRRFRLYVQLLKLYPPNYYQQYAEQMLNTFADMLDNATSTRQRQDIWLRTALDFPVSLIKQQLSYVGEIMTKQTPHYVTRNAKIGTLLIIPFFTLIIANSLSHHQILINNSRLLNDILLFMVAGLPMIAFLLNAGTFIKWAAERRTQQKVSLFKSLFDLVHNWPMVVVAGLGLLIVLFIFGHDGAHCVTQNPVTTLKYWHSTLRCLQTS